MQHLIYSCGCLLYAWPTSTMKIPRRRRASLSLSCPPFLLYFAAVAIGTAACASATSGSTTYPATAATAAAAGAERWRRHGRSAFVPNPSSSGGPRHGRRRTASSPVKMVRQAAGTTRGVRGDDDSGRSGSVAVHDDSWYLGDGGFAERHLEDEEHIAAKQTEKDFFIARSLSVYNQMREASMLLLAQQQLLAAEEAREESSKPRFVARAGSQAARAQAIRDRVRKKREAAAGFPPGQAVQAASSLAEKEGRGGGDDGELAVVIPTAPGMLSGITLGVGGLDEELEEIRRRVCVPLAAPADLLEDLGISPVRGLLLHGPPGCGKTLLARRLSAALTSRPPTVVSGPEILERFVGSSEANIRALFDYPPDVPGGGDAEQAETLHVIVMDEFDSIGQRRGGGDDGGDRVRDSVVNQLLARMDGFQELDRPTLLVALTNRIDLLDSALLRPGRFEVQVQIPGPDLAGREAILRIHTRRMYEAERIDIPPPDQKSPASPPAHAANANGGNDNGYDSLVSSLAAVTDGFTGAELAGLVRAAASYALERAVSGGGGDGGSGARGCRVTAEDFGQGLADVSRSKSSGERPSTGTEEVLAAAAAPAVVDGGREKAVGGAVGDADGGGVGRPRAAVAKSTAAAVAAVAAARLEDDIGGSLSPQDLEAVQKLLLQKTSQKEGEDALLFDAAQVVSQRRRSSGGGVEKEAETEPQAGDEEKDAKRKPKMKTFENTGWFHTYE